MNVIICECQQHAFAATSRHAGVIILDATDAPAIRDRTWTARKDKNTLYAVAVIGGKMTRLHGLLGANRHDHINRNGLDNRWVNLRPASQSQNIQNRRPKPGGSSRYLGVHKHGRRWRARIGIDMEVIAIGSFASEVEAAKAYDERALRYHGPFAYQNFPQSP